MKGLIPPLALELAAAIDLLEQHGYPRAANVLKPVRQKELDKAAGKPKRATKPVKGRWVSASGRTFKQRGAPIVLESQIEEQSK